MNIDKFIEDNEEKIYDMCLSAANKMLPYKKGIGYSQRKNIHDEANFIFENLFKPCMYKANISKERHMTMDSGFYRVTVDIYNDSIFMYIDFMLEDKEFDIGDK